MGFCVTMDGFSFSIIYPKWCLAHSYTKKLFIV